MKRGHSLAHIPTSTPTRLNRQSPQFQGLVSVWNFNASRYANVIKDLAGINDANPSSTNYGWQETDNELGTGIFVDGSADAPCVFDCGNDASLAPSAMGLTICIWCRLYQSNGHTNFPGLIGKGDADSSHNGSYLMYLTAGGHLNYLDYSGGNRVDSLTGATGLDYQLTYLLCATWKPSTRAAIFINGLLEAATTSSVPATLDNPAYNFLIGSNQGGGTKTAYNFRGMLHEARLYNRALSDDEIFELWNPPTRWDLYQAARSFASKPAGAVAGARSFPIWWSP